MALLDRIYLYSRYWQGKDMKFESIGTISKRNKCWKETEYGYQLSYKFPLPIYIQDDTLVIRNELYKEISDVLLRSFSIERCWFDPIYTYSIEYHYTYNMDEYGWGDKMVMKLVFNSLKAKDMPERVVEYRNLYSGDYISSWKEIHVIEEDGIITEIR